MRLTVKRLVTCLFLVASLLLAQDRAKPVSLIQLIATPEKFDGKQVTVNGFLVIGEHPEFFGQQPVLYLNEEDSKNLLLGNSVWVVPSEQMRRDREKIDHMYVTVTGTFQTAHGGDRDAYEGGTITRVQACAPWSDPTHPIGTKPNARKYK